MKHISRLQSGLLLAATATMFCGCPAQQGGNNKALIVGLETGFPPMEFVDEKGDIAGFDVDLASEVAKRLGYVLKINLIAWDNKEHELKSGHIDCIWSSLTISEERAKTMLFTPPYLKNAQVLLVRNESGITEPEALTGKKIGVQANTSSHSTIEAHPTLGREPTEVIKYPDIPTILMDFQNGVLDAIMIDSVFANHVAKNPDNAFSVLDQAFSEEEYGVGFRPENEALRDNVWRTLKEMETDGTVAKISQKWFGTNLSIIGAD